MLIPELEQVRIFKDLDTQSFSDICQFCTKLELSDGEVLISENEQECCDIFVLCKGKVEILSNSSGITSNEVTLSEQDKEIYGEISWLSGIQRTATIRCHGPVVAVHINGKQLYEYLESNPQSGFLVMRSIAQLLAESMGQTNKLLKQILWNEIL